MKIKITFIMLSVFFSAITAFPAEYKITFSNYMITDPELIDQISEMSKTNANKYTSDVVRFIEKSAVFHDEYSVITSNGCVVADTLQPIPYAQQDGDKYKLVHSDKKTGFRCSFEVEDLSNFIFVTGSWQFYSLCERESFDPFPDIDAGQPKKVLGGRNKNLMLYKNTSHIGAYGLMRKADGIARSLTMMLIRYEIITEK